MQVWGTNTLHVESKPGLGDFHPLKLSYGQLCRFWGNQCHHYTVANQTDFTRVSFDLRVIPRSLYTGAFAGHIGDYPTAISRGPHATESEQLFRRGVELLKNGSCHDGQHADGPESDGGVCDDPLSLRIPPSVDESFLATRILSAAAEMGHIAAEGLCWEHGLGRAVDPSLAVACLTLEAEQGHAEAQYHLACAFWRRSAGDAASTEARSAIRWWRKAGNQGHPGALRCLGQWGPSVTLAVSVTEQAGAASCAAAESTAVVLRDLSISLAAPSENGDPEQP